MYIKFLFQDKFIKQFHEQAHAKYFTKYINESVEVLTCICQ